MQICSLPTPTTDDSDGALKLSVFKFRGAIP
jgi:hypothetical protein